MSDLRIATPCHENWEAMTAHGQGRHCAACAKTVVDIAAMSPSQARRVLRQELPERIARGERVCVRAPADASGRLKPGRAKRYLLTNGLAAILAMAAYGCSTGNQAESGGGPAGQQPQQGIPQQPVQPQQQQQQQQPLMGAIAPPPPHGPVVEPQPLMGKVAAQSIRGEVSVVEPQPQPVGEPMVMGDIAQPPQGEPAPSPEPGPSSP